MQLDIGNIMGAYRKRVSLLQDLLASLERERNHLIHQDIDGIWSTMEEKQKILESIEETKVHMRNMAGMELSYKDIPVKDRPSFAELSQTLTALKEEVKIRVCENISFITETLDFFHEIIGAFAAAGNRQGSYGARKANSHQHGIMYHSEV